MEDLISIGSIGLIKAVNTFKRDKNIKLVTYASRCIENEILMFLRKKSRRKVEVSFDEPLNIDYDGNELLLSDILGTDDDVVTKEFEKKENKRELLEAMSTLKERERQILQMRYGIQHEELTQKDIAKRLGISQSYISRLEKRIIAKLKVQMCIRDRLMNYTYNVLTRFFDEGDPNIENAHLIAKPNDPYLVLGSKNTLYTYEPKDLVSINDLPHASLVPQANDITIKKEVVKPLKELMAAAGEVNQKENGDMKVIAGYISYEDQMKLFEKAKLVYGEDVLQHWDYPGQSEFQLGYTVRLLPNGLTTEFDEKKESDKDKDAGKKEEAKSSDKKEKKNPSEEERDQEIWLKDNAYKFGFIIRYPKQKEDATGKRYQPYTLRYVGKEIAKKLHDEGYVLDEVNISDLKE